MAVTRPLACSSSNPCRRRHCLHQSLAQAACRRQQTPASTGLTGTCQASGSGWKTRIATGGSRASLCAAGAQTQSVGPAVSACGLRGILLQRSRGAGQIATSCRLLHAENTTSSRGGSRRCGKPLRRHTRQPCCGIRQQWSTSVPKPMCRQAQLCGVCGVCGGVGGWRVRGGGRGVTTLA